MTPEKLKQEIEKLISQSELPYGDVMAVIKLLNDSYKRKG